MFKKKIKQWVSDGFELEMTTHWSFSKRGDWATHDAKWRGNWSLYISRNVILRYSLHLFYYIHRKISYRFVTIGYLQSATLLA